MFFGLKSLVWPLLPLGRLPNFRCFFLPFPKGCPKRITPFSKYTDLLKKFPVLFSLICIYLLAARWLYISKCLSVSVLWSTDKISSDRQYRHTWRRLVLVSKWPPNIQYSIFNIQYWTDIGQILKFQWLINDGWISNSGWKSNHHLKSANGFGVKMTA